MGVLDWPSPSRRDVDLSPALRALRDGHAAGAYELPEQTVRALEAHGRLRAWLSEAGTEVEAGGRATLEGIEVLVKAALDGKKEAPSAGKRVLQAERRAQEGAAQVRLVHRALADLPIRAGEVIITDHLRPALAEVLKQVAGAVKSLGSRALDPPPEPRDLEDLPGAKQNAWGKLREAAERYSLIRRSWRGLRHPREDEGNVFGEIRNLEKFWDPRTVMGRQEVAPWPGETARKLGWAALTASPERPVLWLPTAEEQDARYLEWVKALREAG